MSDSVLEYTPVEEIPKIVNSLKRSFRAKKTSSIEFRLNQLRSLYYALKDNEDLIIKSLKRDLNKPESETQLTELAVSYADLLDIIKQLPTWSKPTSAKGTNFLFKFTSPRITKIPLGTVLIVVPFNFPILLTIGPLAGAIAAGNNVVLKQSEQSPYTSQILTDILTEALDPSIFQCVNGGISEITELLDQKFDKILFTGSGSVGRIIARKAADTLTPVVLELGGKSPAILTKSIKGNLEAVAKRIAFTTFTNAGQVCTATDYILMDEEIHDEFLLEFQKAIDIHYPPNIKTFGKLVNTRAWDRIVGLLKQTKGDIAIGDLSVADREGRFIPPIVVKDVEFGDSLLSEEIFGPVVPIIKFKNLQTEVIDPIVDSWDTPLALYIYSHNKEEIEQVSSQIRSGAVVINDGMIHVGLNNIPFGGIGESGYGSYHGKWSFDTFSHERSQLNNPFWTEILFKSKYPPVSDFDLGLSKFFLVPRPTFGRTGRVRDHNYGLAILTVIIGFIGILVGYFEK